MILIWDNLPASHPPSKAKLVKSMTTIAATAAVALSSITLSLTTEAEDRFIEELTIVGERSDEHQVTGAALYIGSAQLQEQNYSDIQRILRQAPGVSVQVEDGYGLRPNISIRGVATERSGRITLLEDNVLISPAPYSAPSAYYFPTVGRMSGVEILKGPAAISQGPYTIGGAMNMISTSIPNDMGGKVTAEAGEDSTYRVHATYGGKTENGFGFLLETHQWQSDGFQDIDRSGNDTGLDVEDYTVKLSYTNDRHGLELKLQYASQDSDQSYLGLTDADFNQDAYRRYGLSALDNIHTEHEQQILRYQFQINENATFTATVYNNEHERNWFKTEGIDFDGSTSAGNFSKTSWSNVVNAINQGSDLGGLNSLALQSILDGGDTAAGSIQVRSNAREYYSRGMQFALDLAFETGDARHELEIGLRIHEDEEDRLQRNSTYSQQNGQLVLDDLGLLGNAGNRIQEAEALALHIYDRIEIGNWVLTPGIRYEDIEQERTRYETRDGRTTNPASRAEASVRDGRSNDTEVWLPGMGVLYKLNDNTTIIAGVHKGFTAPSNSPGVDEEEAINYEFGFRYKNKDVSGELIYFHSDYDNLLGECTASSGSDCTIGDAFNGDAATVQGLELIFATELKTKAGYMIPLSFNYTYINSEFDTDIASTDFFGDVAKGDPIPYIPEHQYNLSVGLLVNKWSGYLNASYVDETCVRASCGAFEKTDDAITLDVSAHYAVSDRVDVYGKVENITGTEDIMGRQPYGARPNKDRTATLGVSFQL
ncbi:MAG: Fe(3+) dicitrate transport protein [Candidatus Azotimanducaceae bacterium]|jgi:Fe(3+) dicitrate transport protein